MKNVIRFVAFIAIAALSFSCNKNEIENVIPSNEQGIPFTLYASASQTKTTNDGLNTAWADGDKINVFHAVTGTTTYINDGAFELKDASTGEFSGHLASNLEAGTNYDWYMIYPYNSNLTTPATTSTQASNNKDYFTIGGNSQTQTGNNSMSHLAGKNVPFAGKVTNVADTDTPTLELTPLVSVISVNVTNNSGNELTVTDVAFGATESVVGTYFVNFAGDTPTYVATQNYYVYTSAPLTVSGADALADGSSAKYYIAIKPFTVSSGKLTVTVNGFEKELNITKSTSFKAGKIKTLNFDYTKAIAEPISTDSDVTVGFEASEGFTTSTTYNNQTVAYNGSETDGTQWGILSGTVATNNKISGSNSLQLRWYASNPATIPSAFTDFRLSSVGNVKFKAKSGDNGLGVKVYYSLDNRATWVEANTYELSATATEYTVSFEEVLTNAAFKFEAILPATLPSSGNLPLIIDDVIFSKTLVVPSVTVATNPASEVSGEHATLNGVITLVNGAKLNDLTEAGFYFKENDGSFQKVSLTLPLSSNNISKTIDVNDGSDYTYYAFAKYKTKDAVNGSVETFTAENGGGGEQTATITVGTFGSSWSSYADKTGSVTGTDNKSYSVAGTNIAYNKDYIQARSSKSSVIYNKTSFGKITKITIVDTTGATFTVTAGTSESPTGSTSVTADGNRTWNISGSNGYFKIVNANTTIAHIESITITYIK